MGLIQKALHLGFRLASRSRFVRIVVAGLQFFVLLAFASVTNLSRADDGISAGPLYDQFKLTLENGDRTEALGPLFYDEDAGVRRTWAVPPFVSSAIDPSVELSEFDILYPLITCDRYGEQYRWQFFQILSWGGGPMPDINVRDRFTLFPIYFQQRSSETNENYTAVFPFYGHLKHRIFRDEIYFIIFPLFSETRKADVVTDNYLFPLFDVHHGDGLRGWQFWPLVGHEHKSITTQTNGFGDVKTIGGRDETFVLWPFYFDVHTGIGTKNPEWDLLSFPFFNVQRSTQRDSTSVLWLFSHETDRGQKYREWDLPWPFIEFARGEGKTANRVWPFFSQTQKNVYDKDTGEYKGSIVGDSYVWPIYKVGHIRSEPLDRKRKRVCFWLFDDLKETNTETGAVRQHVNLWPLFIYHRGFDGRSRFQTLAIAEPFLAGAHKIERDYSPLWSLWRTEKNPKTGASSRSLLWNLYRRDQSRTSTKTSVFFGLFQSNSDSAGAHVRLFYVPLGNRAADKAMTGAPPGGDVKK